MFVQCNVINGLFIVTTQKWPTIEYIKIIIIFVIVIIHMITYFSCQYILKKNGYQTSLHFGYFRDIANMKKLANTTYEPKLRFKYFLIARLLFWLIPIYFFITIVLLNI